MATLLESKIKAQVAAAFAGKLLTGTLRRIAVTALDDAGNPATTSAATYSFDGIRDTFDARFRAQAQIPETDVKVLIIAGSLSTTPVIDDQIKINDVWHQVRAILAVDPAGATYELQVYEIEDPT